MIQVGLFLSVKVTYFSSSPPQAIVGLEQFQCGFPQEGTSGKNIELHCLVTNTVLGTR